MNIDLELYKVFYVAKNKHMTKASEELHNQPANLYRIYLMHTGLF